MLRLAIDVSQHQGWWLYLLCGHRKCPGSARDANGESGMTAEDTKIRRLELVHGEHMGNAPGMGNGEWPSQRQESTREPGWLLLSLPARFGKQRRTDDASAIEEAGRDPGRPERQHGREPA